MIEVYVVLTLLGVGYMLNQTKSVKMNMGRQVNVSQLDSNTNPYKSDHLNVARKIEANKAAKMFALSQKPLQPKNKQTTQQAPVVGNNALFKSPLSGQDTDFAHNNMMPFGRVRQNANIDGNKNVLEHMNGTSDLYKQKKEQQPLFEPQRDVDNIYGTRNNLNAYLQYYENPKNQNNVLPFQQVRVGPGINKGFTADPSGGFQQADMREFAMPKDTNELRVANKPKETFKGRIISGQKGAVRGKTGTMAKNRVETFYENTEDMYIKTTGAYLKDKQRPEVEVKYTNRKDTTSTNYQGPAYQRKGDQERPEAQAPLKAQLAPFEIANPKLDTVGQGVKADYGKANILVYSNERDITTTRTYQGGLTSIVKALIAPIEDIIKVTKKEYMVDNARTYGSLQPQIPAKAPTKDPNDVMRTTIKETLIHDAERLNVKGPAKITVYDPNNVARTTIKETLIHDADSLNVKGPVKLTVYDPNDVARVTMKETMIHDAGYSTIKPPSNGNVVHNEQKAKTTVRETIDPMETSLNLKPNIKGVVYDPNVKAKTTIKETLLDKADTIGNLDRTDRKIGAYLDALDTTDVKTTQKEFLSNNDYSGNPAQPNADGYKVTDVEAKTTQKEFLSNFDYYGGAADQTQKQPMSYEDIYNAEIDNLKESTLYKREPTKTGAKVAISGEDINIDIKKLPMDEPEERLFTNIERIIQTDMMKPSDETFTRSRNIYQPDTRLDTDILEALQDNPYALSLNSSSCD